MEFKRVTDLEEIDALPDDATILVIDGDAAKRISKANAKFGGGGGVTVFYSDQTFGSHDYGDNETTAIYSDAEKTTKINAQTLHDAFKNGSVMLSYAAANGLTLTAPLFEIAWVDANETQTDETAVTNVYFFYIYYEAPKSPQQGSLIGEDATVLYTKLS